MKIINKVKAMAKVSYEFIKMIPTEAKVGAVANFAGGAAIGNGVVSVLVGDAVKGTAKTIGGVGLLVIGTTMVNNGIDKMDNEKIADFYEKCAEDLNSWIEVGDDQIADSADITDMIDHDQF